MQRDMRYVRPAIEKWEKEGELPPAFQKIKCHFVFDIKISENFQRKARLVANGNEMETPASLTYSSVVSRDSATLMGIQATFKLKDNKIEKPENYLGAQISMQKIIDGRECWAMTSEQYIKSAIAYVEATLNESGQRLPSKAMTPMQANYRPELDTSAELRLEGMCYYQELIGVLRWAIELVSIDIVMEVSMLSTHLALPREGHLQQVCHIFAFLKNTPKRTIAFDPQHPNIEESRIAKCDWHDFYCGAKEPIPGDAPEPRGNVVSTLCFVDADHAGNREICRSQSGILLFVNRAPVIWYSKWQNTVETSTFGSEFMAMRIAVELLESLRYKLRMFGVPIEGPTNVFCDNEAVTKKAIFPEPTLKKKHNAIAYHLTREAVAAGTIRVTKEDGTTNLADVLTKPLPQARNNLLCDRFMY